MRRLPVFAAAADDDDELRLVLIQGQLRAYSVRSLSFSTVATSGSLVTWPSFGCHQLLANLLGLQGSATVPARTAEWPLSHVALERVRSVCVYLRVGRPLDFCLIAAQVVETVPC